jgi:hypothetical protein
VKLTTHRSDPPFQIHHVFHHISEKQVSQAGELAPVDPAIHNDYAGRVLHALSSERSQTVASCVE